MNDHTPSTEEVRDGYADRDLGYPNQDDHVDFDRWLTSERSRIWDEAKAAVVEFYENPALPEPVNPYRKGGDT